MAWWVAIAVGTLLIAAMLFLRRSAMPTHAAITLNGITPVYDSLKKTGQHGSFAALIPPSVGDEAVNIQFSIEDGVIGLDWVLLSPINIRDRALFEELLTREGVEFAERSMNDVAYLRTTDVRAPGLCRQVLEEIYAVPNNVDIDLVIEGWDWSPMVADRS